MAVKNLKLALLFDIYGELLSERQKRAFEMYYCDDLSLSEIAEHMGITRQGVRDQIKHAEEELARYEDKLSLYEKNAGIRKALDELSEAVKDKEEFSTVNDIIRRVQTLLDI